MTVFGVCGEMYLKHGIAGVDVVIPPVNLRSSLKKVLFVFMLLSEKTYSTLA